MTVKQQLRWRIEGNAGWFIIDSLTDKTIAYCWDEEEAKRIAAALNAAGGIGRGGTP